MQVWEWKMDEELRELAQRLLNCIGERNTIEAYLDDGKLSLVELPDDITAVLAEMRDYLETEDES